MRGIPHHTQQKWNSNEAREPDVVAGYVMVSQASLPNGIVDSFVSRGFSSRLVVFVVADYQKQRVQVCLFVF